MNRDLPVERLDMTLNELLRQQPVQWHGVRLNTPDWSTGSHHTGGYSQAIRVPAALHIMINVYREPLEFEIPVVLAKSSPGGYAVSP
jgi:isoamylase